MPNKSKYCESNGANELSADNPHTINKQIYASQVQLKNHNILNKDLLVDSTNKLGVVAPESYRTATTTFSHSLSPSRQQQHRFERQRGSMPIPVIISSQ